MFATYRQSWHTHPGFNILFLCAMATAWGIYALLYTAALPWGSNQANVLVFVVAALCLIFIFGTPRYGFKPTAVLRHHGGHPAALAAQRAGNYPAERHAFFDFCRPRTIGEYPRLLA